jgi:hypothetical protein
MFARTGVVRAAWSRKCRSGRAATEAGLKKRDGTMTNIGFTGTRQGMTEAQRSALRGLLDGGAGEFHHGDCIGADSQAHDIASKCGYRIVLHPPTNPSERAWREAPGQRKRPEKPYLDRNKDIVRETVSLIAAPAEPEEQLLSGAWSTVRFARKMGRPVFLILPDGSVIR